jgi:superfamily I DNA/RNA helicase
MISPEAWRPADGLRLEPNAELAVRETTRSLARTAGPGAGKTEVLAQRADFLFRTATSPYPRRILAISFKVDAARNLKERVQRRCGYRLASRLDSHTFHAFAKRLIDRYRPVLTGINALDRDYTVGLARVQGKQIRFEDFLPLALEIVQKSQAARSALRQTYSHVFLDEFQDCTRSQYELLHAAFHESATLLTAVGDTKQRIMGWAGALEGIFKKLAADFEARPLNLYQNFRSQPRLRRMQNSMIEVMDPDAASSIESLGGEGGTVEVVRFDNDEEEAEYVVQLIDQLLGGGTPHSEVAVLVSKQPHLYAAPLMAKLTEIGISYRNEQSLQDLTVEPIAEIILDLLRVVLDERQPEAYTRLMNMAAGMAADEDSAHKARARAYRYIQASRVKVKDDTFNREDSNQIRHLVVGFLELVGREAVTALSADYQRGRRLDELVADTLKAFNEQLALDHDPAAALRRISEDTAVRILTIHKSKGLEFETVIIIGIEHETFFGNINDERSAFFVGISRAKSRLILTTANERPQPDGHVKRWSVHRHSHHEFLSYASESTQ